MYNILVTQRNRIYGNLVYKRLKKESKNLCADFLNNICKTIIL